MKITKDIPLLGVIQFGIIDRRTNLLQIRPTTKCNLRCRFCSTAAGKHTVEYEISANYLIEWVKYIIKLKECNEIEANIDSVGESTTYPELIDLIKGLKKLPEIKLISMQTNGILLKIKELEKAGLNRINLSIHALDKDLAKKLSGTEYNIDNILKTIKEIKKTKIELNLTPVYLPKVNDQEIHKLIKLAKSLKCNILIQKYETYRYSRKLKKADRISWYKFYKQLEEWEKEYNVKLKYGNFKYNIKKAKSIPKIFEKNENITAEIILPGWYKDQMIATAKNRLITIQNCNKKIHSKVRIKVINNDNNIYLAKQV